MKLYYEEHIFVCTNVRGGNNKISCGGNNSLEIKSYMKKKVKEAAIKDFRITSSGYLNRCKLGPIMAVHPQGILLKVKDKKDRDLLIEELLVKNKIVNKLLV